MRTVLLLAGLAAAGFAARLLPAPWAASASSGRGIGTFTALAALSCAVGAPRQAAAFAGGFAFGFWEGGALAWLAAMLACAVNFFWARAIAREWARRWLRGRLARADGFIAAHPFGAVLSLRLLPIGNNLALNLAGGISGASAAPFLAASALGYLPQTVIFALLGEGVHVARVTQIAAGAAMFVASGVIGGVLFRRVRLEGAGQ